MPSTARTSPSIEKILADDFMATYDDGKRGDKPMELALAAEFNQEVESAIQDDFTVGVYHDTAVAWFNDGRRQCVSTQSTKVNPG
jgi:hypothetical protein